MVIFAPRMSALNELPAVESENLTYTAW